MKEYPIVLMSVVIQIVAAALALRLCWITEKITAWVLIAVAISFMALRRCFTLYEWISRSTPLQPLDISNEMVGLAISVLMLAGITLIAPLFLSIKQSEKKIRQNEEKYRLLVSNIPSVVFMGYPDGTMDFFDNKVTEVTGYPKEAFDSRVMKWLDIVVEEDVEEAKRVIIQALNSERAYVREYRIRHKDEKILWIQERSQIVCDEQGKIKYISGVFYDITRQKQVEEELRTAKSRLQFLISTTPALIYSCKPYGDFGATFVSDNITMIFGYKPQEFVEDSSFWANRIHPEDRPRVFAELPKLFEHGYHSHEYRFLHKDGTYRWMQDETRLIRDEAGHPVEIVGYWIDITDRKKAEELLQESEARFRTTFESAPIGISIVDLNGRLLESNRVLQQMLGYGPEELDHMAFCNLSHPEEAPRCIKLFKEMLTGKRDSYRIDYQRYLRKDGGLVWTRLRVSVVKDASGEAYFAIGMIEDITKQKRAEDEIRAYQEKLRSLASELTLVEERERRRLAIQLHENIGQILAFAQIKLGTLTAEATTSDLAADLNELRNQIDHTIQFTRSLTFELSPPTLYELGLGEAVEWLASQFQENCGTEIEVQQEPHPTPLTDEVRTILFLVVRELLTNVAKHAQAHHAKVVIEKDGDQLRIQVEDDGVGFNVAKSGAAGFGLFSIRERLDHIGGHLKVKSKPGHGTVVTLAIPLMPEDKMAESQQR